MKLDGFRVAMMAFSWRNRCRLLHLSKILGIDNFNTPIPPAIVNVAPNSLAKRWYPTILVLALGNEPEFLTDSEGICETKTEGKYKAFGDLGVNDDIFVEIQLRLSNAAVEAHKANLFQKPRYTEMDVRFMRNVDANYAQLGEMNGTRSVKGCEKGWTYQEEDMMKTYLAEPPVYKHAEENDSPDTRDKEVDTTE